MHNPIKKLSEGRTFIQVNEIDENAFQSLFFCVFLFTELYHSGVFYTF